MLNFWRNFIIYFSDQAEAHRAKNKATRERRAIRVAAKRDALLGIETPVADKAVKAQK